MLDNNRDFLVGIVAVVSLATVLDSFNLRHILLGLLLLLFLFAEWKRKDSNYTQVAYAAVAGCCALLTMGRLIDLFLQCIKQSTLSEYAYVIIWIICSLIIYIVRKIYINLKLGDEK